jgi:hypothetical protein
MALTFAKERLMKTAAVEPSMDNEKEKAADSLGTKNVWPN